MEAILSTNIRTREAFIKRILIGIALSTLFIATFAIPITVALRFSGAFGRTVTPRSDIEAMTSDAPRILEAGAFLKVAASPQLDPKENEDFIIISWVRFSKLIRPDEKAVFLTKYNPHSPAQEGYALGLARDALGMRPIVYWRNHAGVGRWYSFSEVTIPALEWVMFGLSFTEGKFLGLHIATLNEKEGYTLRVLGGYEVDPPIIPQSDRPLVIGAPGNSKFRGKIGPFGILSHAGLSTELNRILQQAADDPGEVPPAVSSHSVMLWSVNAKEDTSAAQHTIERSGFSERSTREGGRKKHDRQVQQETST